MAQKFNNQRYCTKGISERLPIMTQVILWELIQSMEVEEQDYLQVFTCTEGDGKQKLIHIQEEPEYRREYLIKTDAPIFCGKIFIDYYKFYDIDKVNEKEAFFLKKLRLQFNNKNNNYK